MIETKNIPPALLENGLFCCWQYEERNGRRTKVPYNPRTGGRAQSTNPATFTPLAAALAALQSGGYNGIGVGIFGRLGAIDIDHCINDAGTPSPLALDVLNTMQSYTEYSPSGKGLHILFTVPDNFIYDKARYYINNQKAGLEVYIVGSTNKFVTITGNALPHGFALEERGEQIQAVLERYMVRPQAERPTQTPARATVDLDDLELINRAKRSKNGTAFAALMAGDTTGYQSQSEADMALCNMLAFWTNKDATQIDRIFRTSGLMREKWDRQQSGSTYGAITIQNAIDTAAQTYDPEYRPTAAQDFAPESGKLPAIVRASEVPYEPPRWTIPPYIQRGKGTLIQADNGTGKTAFVCAIAAHVSTGRALLDIPVETPGDVLLLSVEDDLPVLRGRIEASGGNLDKCHFLTNAAGLSFNSPEVEAAVKQVQAKLIIFDPLQAFLGAKVDMFRANETRPELAKLFEMCDRNDCACIIIAHTIKSIGDKSPVNRALGSVDIPAAMRSVIQIIENPDNTTERIAIHVKCSNAPRGKSMVYTIGDRGGVKWVGFSPMTAEDLTVVVKRKEKGIPYENEPLVQVFNQLVTDRPGGGFWSYADLKSEGAKILGFPPFYSTADLKQKLDSAFSKELQERDGLIITCGCKSNGVRGVRIEQYQQPQGYQISIQD